MTLTYGEARVIEKWMAEESQSDSKTGPEFIKEIADWYAACHREGRAPVDPETFAALCEYARDSSYPECCRLAGCALQFARDCASERPEQSQFGAEFALKRMRALTGQSDTWDRINLTEKEEGDARALFEAAIQDHSYTDRYLSDRTHEFVREYRGEGNLFGRLAADLLFLVQVLGDGSVGQTEKNIARAALIYFAEVPDAISDDFGLAGLLDDTYIVQQAIRKITPDRAVIGDAVDDVVRRWPYVKRLKLVCEQGAYMPSEFMLLNAGLLGGGDGHDGSHSGTAVIVQETGPLAYVMGTIYALGEIYTRLDWELPSFRKGERLIHRETRAEVIFDSYGVMEDAEFIVASEAEATHFRVTEEATRKKHGPVTYVRGVEDIRGFDRSGKEKGSKRHARIAFGTEKSELGALEQLFNCTRPIVLPTDCGVVVVVAPVGEAYRFVSEQTLYGVALKEFLPVGVARVRGDHVKERTWTTGHIGGASRLLFVPTSDAALALVEGSERDVRAVVATVRSNSTDAMNLRRIVDSGAPVLAIVKETDKESQEHLRSAAFGCWYWEKRWLDVVHMAYPSGDEDNPFAQYELRLREKAGATERCESLKAEHLRKAFDALNEVKQKMEEDEDRAESLIATSIPILLSISRLVVPASDGLLEYLEGKERELHEIVDANERWWTDEICDLAITLVTHISDAIRTVRESNPKWDALQEFLHKDETLNVLASKTVAESIRKVSPSCIKEFGWEDGDGGSSTRTLIPAWFNREQMDRALSNPPAAKTILLLYEPEMEWYEAWRRRRELRVRRIRSWVLETSPVDGITETVPSNEVSTAPRDDRTDPDELIWYNRRQEVQKRFADERDELMEGMLVGFVGGYWGVFALSYRFSTVTHLLEWGDEEGGADEIQHKNAADLEPGDLVLMVRGTDRDALRAAVDRKAAGNIRCVAGEWRRAVERFVRTKGTVSELTEKLAKAGCVRTEATVNRWLEDSAIIGPRSIEKDIPAIAAATDDRELKQRLEECKDAIENLRSLHVKVGQDLARQVIDRAKEWINAGVTPDDLVELEQQLVLVSVEDIDRDRINVPRSQINQLQEVRWQG